MKLRKIALALFLGAASMAASAADNSTSKSPDASGSLFFANATTTDHNNYDAFRIVTALSWRGG